MCVLSRSSLLHADLPESPSPGHVVAPASPKPLALRHYDPTWPHVTPPPCKPPDPHLSSSSLSANLTRRSWSHWSAWRVFTGALPRKEQWRNEERLRCIRHSVILLSEDRNIPDCVLHHVKGPIRLHMNSFVHSANPSSPWQRKYDKTDGYRREALMSAQDKQRGENL